MLCPPGPRPAGMQAPSLLGTSKPSRTSSLAPPEPRSRRSAHPAILTAETHGNLFSLLRL